MLRWWPEISHFMSDRFTLDVRNTSKDYFTFESYVLAVSLLFILVCFTKWDSNLKSIGFKLTLSDLLIFEHYFFLIQKTIFQFWTSAYNLKVSRIYFNFVQRSFMYAKALRRALYGHFDTHDLKIDSFVPLSSH